MSRDTAGGIRAMQELERVVREATREADDPGLRDSFAELLRAPIRVICCGLDKGINHGNILRVAECFRIEEVCFSPVSRSKETDYTGGFAALKWQPYRWVEPAEALRQANKDGFRVYGLTLSERSTALRSVAWQHPAAIVLGQELTGIEPEVAEQCDELIAVPLYGMVQSLNVAVTCGIAIEHCLAAYVSKNPEFAPARKLSAGIVDD